MAVMISILPEWVKRILKGEKTIEIRKTMPKLNSVRYRKAYYMHQAKQKK